MNKLRELCQVLAVCCAAVVGLVVAPVALAADTTWKDVREAGELRCGAAQAAPYVMKNPRTEEYGGFFVEVCRQFADHLGVEVEFVDTNWDNIVAGAQSGRWDLALALNETPERANAVAFSEWVSRYQISFLYDKSNSNLPDSIDSLSDLDKSNITIAVMSGTVQDKAVTRKFENAEVMRLPGMDETRLAIMSHRADVLADAKNSNLLFHHANSDWSKTFTPDPPLAAQAVAFGLNKSTPDADLEELDEFIVSMRESGEIEELINQAAKEAAEETE